MKNLSTDPALIKIRRVHPTLGWGDDNGGYFCLNNLRIIAGNGDGWDHVSVSLPDRCPTWGEMCKVKSLFFDKDEMVIQYHPPEKDYINIHEHVLHLWRPHDDHVRLPHAYMV